MTEGWCLLCSSIGMWWCRHGVSCVMTEAWCVMTARWCVLCVNREMKRRCALCDDKVWYVMTKVKGWCMLAEGWWVLCDDRWMMCVVWWMCYIMAKGCVCCVMAVGCRVLCHSSVVVYDDKGGVCGVWWQKDGVCFVMTGECCVLFDYRGKTQRLWLAICHCTRVLRGWSSCGRPINWWMAAVMRAQTTLIEGSGFGLIVGSESGMKGSSGCGLIAGSGCGLIEVVDTAWSQMVSVAWSQIVGMALLQVFGAWSWLECRCHLLEMG